MVIGSFTIAIKLSFVSDGFVFFFFLLSSIYGFYDISHRKDFWDEVLYLFRLSFLK